MFEKLLNIFKKNKTPVNNVSKTPVTIPTEDKQQRKQAISQKNVIKDTQVLMNYNKVKESKKLGFEEINPRFPSSRPNRIDQEGTKWSTTKELKDNSFLETNDKAYIDNIMMFKEFGEVSNNESIYGTPFNINDAQQGKKLLSIDLGKRVHFSKLNLTRSMLALGGVGSGKTEWALSLVTQRSLYNRIIFNDIKGDFVGKLFRENSNDIIFNLFDERGTDWNVFEDLSRNPALAKSFAKSMVMGGLGDKADDNEWVSFATGVIYKAIMYAYTNTTDNHLRWLYLMEKMEKEKADAESGDDKNKASVWMNVQNVYEILQLMTYRIVILKKKTFSIYQLFQTKDVQVFLLNNSAYEKSLLPLFGAFMSTFINIMMSRADTKTDLTMLMLDEFLSLKIPEDEQNKLFTAARSKGCQTVVMSQFLKKTDEKLLQLIESSRYALLLFSIKDSFTLESMSKIFGKVTYWQKIISSSSSMNLSNMNANAKQDNDDVQSNTSSITRNSNDTKTDIEFLSVTDITSIPPYHHITNISTDKITYLGYTPSVPSSVFENNETFIEINQDEILKFHYKSADKAYTNILKEVLSKGGDLAETKRLQDEENERNSKLKDKPILSNDKFKDIKELLENNEIEKVKEILYLHDISLLNETIQDIFNEFLKHSDDVIYITSLLNLMNSLLNTNDRKREIDMDDVIDKAQINKYDKKDLALLDKLLRQVKEMAKHPNARTRDDFNSLEKLLNKFPILDDAIEIYKNMDINNPSQTIDDIFQIRIIIERNIKEIKSNQGETEGIDR